ncbi:MAG: hypothetical protein R3354_02515 [Thiohalomonadales bacterium]|nr:hypothetical protein [Thiohalomonadales bacterium]
MNQDHEKNLQVAQDIVTEYGHLLAQLDSSSYAHPLSSLPYDKDEIKSAIHLLLWELHGQNHEVSNSLAQSYVYLAQFVDDTEAETVARGQAFLQSSDLDPEELIYADRAVVIINRIKVEMENLMQDLKGFLT